ncbi:MAG: response regulator, partial [Candidatus Latescibacteria bacterium]|nr:response regulator [Candidatus Latescibacterota bacterium]
AHDFNNILASIMGYIDLIRMNTHNIDTVQAKYLEEASKSCNRAAGLVQEFLSLTLESGSDKSVVDIFEIADEVFTILKRTTDKIIEKKNDIDPGKYLVYMKADQLHQALLNLGTNSASAIELKNSGQREFIRISARERFMRCNELAGMPEGKYIHIIFEDSGAGMTDEVKRRAFEPLFTTKSRGSQKGQGLGLAMVYQIITRNHHGYIDIETVLGQGTTFHIYIPKAPSIQKNIPGAPADTVGGHETLLFVEDEESIRNFTAEALKGYGYRIITASEGREGLEIYSEKGECIDLVILDLTMPVMSGEELMKKLLEINPLVKVIVTSGHGEGVIRNIKAAKGYIAKPFHIDEFARTIRNALDMENDDA